MRPRGRRVRRRERYDPHSRVSPPHRSDMFCVWVPAAARRHAAAGTPPPSTFACALLHLRSPAGHRDHRPDGDALVSLGGRTRGGEDCAPPSGPAPAPSEGPGLTTTRQKPPYAGLQSDGCNGCVVLIRGNGIIVGNAGDSHCVLSRNNQAIELSADFKPNLPAERQRIENAGRAVTITPERRNIPRISDEIAVSRTIGDLQYKDNTQLLAKQQALAALPEVCTENITHGAQFLIIACDGIWDLMASQQAVGFVTAYLNAG
ncbi:unnamed protein product [Urochloa humidicola]